MTNMRCVLQTLVKVRKQQVLRNYDYDNRDDKNCGWNLFIHTYHSFSPKLPPLSAHPNAMPTYR